MEIPFKLDDQVRWILGRPCFAVAGIARVLRNAGVSVATKAEDEQAVAIYWMLEMYFLHGENWRKEADKELKRLLQEQIT